MQFCDLNRQYLAYQSEIDEAIHSVVNSSEFINGKAIQLLEKELAEFAGVKHVLACSSGTDALLMALMAYGIRPGDEVICPAFSFIASASMVALLKATPVFVDVSPVDYNIDVNKIEAKITNRTKGIIAVSLFGQCANFDALNELASKHGIWVIEDGAQSFGAIYKEKKSCALTPLAVTSFFPAKPLGCYGDGGAVFTSDDELADKLQKIRGHGQSARYIHDVIGINGRIDTIQAAILRVKLKYFEQEIEVRNQASERYSQSLHGYVMLPVVNDDCKSTWAQFTIAVEDREHLRKKLSEKGIPTAVHYPIPLPKQQAFSHLPYFNQPYEVSELLSETVISLPMHGLITNEELDEVVNAVIGSL